MIGGILGHLKFFKINQSSLRKKNILKKSNIMCDEQVTFEFEFFKPETFSLLIVFSAAKQK